MGYNFKKIAAMAIISMAVVLSITGCNQNADEDSAFQTLDIEQLETDTTDINDRAEYYDKNVDDRIDEMTDEEKEKMCDIVCEAGADYIKTSTGFSTAGANFHDVELMVKGVRGRCKVKAAGGISTVDDMEKFLALGADRLGTSRAVKILNGEQAKGY